MKKKKIKSRIRQALDQGPLTSGDLVEKLGFDAHQSAFDAATAIAGTSPLTGSFRDSDEQTTLAQMVESKEIIWRRAKNMDNWYALPGHNFPPEADVRKVNLASFVKDVIAALSPEVLDGIETMHVNDISDDDAWVEIFPFVIQMDEDGWELADGDPICNWAGNTFTEKFSIDVDPGDVAKLITSRQKEFNEQRRKRKLRDKEEKNRWKEVLKEVLELLPYEIKVIRKSKSGKFADIELGDKKVRLQMEDEFDDLWLYGYIEPDKNYISFDHEVRFRWVASEYDPQNVVNTICSVLDES